MNLSPVRVIIDDQIIFALSIKQVFFCLDTTAVTSSVKCSNMWNKKLEYFATRLIDFDIKVWVHKESYFPLKASRETVKV